MNTWPIEELGDRFETLLDACLDGSPQRLTRDGVEVAVLIEIDRWQRLNSVHKPSLKQLLLSNAARTDALVPSRPSHARRPTPHPDRSG